MTRKFVGTKKTKRLIPSVGAILEDAAIAQAEEFIAAGQTPRQATSIVANLMIRAAWIVAATGAFAEDDNPDPNRFRASVEEILAAVKFREGESA